MKTPTPTHGDIARNLINSNPEYFGDYHTDYSGLRKQTVVDGYIHSEYRSQDEIKQMILDHLKGTGKDNNNFLNGVLKIIYTLKTRQQCNL